MTMPSGLREFLTSRRAALDPSAVGLPVSAARRRTPGLRREEVAALAGVSVDYIARLEQGRVGNVSDQVLDSIADALRLDDVEREHLRALVGPRSARTTLARRSAKLTVRASTRILLDNLPMCPATVQGPRMEILAANRAARILLTDWDTIPVAERNIARWLFLDPCARTRYPRWEDVAASTVAALRANRDPRVVDPAMERLISELFLSSPEFVRLWENYRLFKHTHGRKYFFHEAVGELMLNYEALDIPDSGGQVLCVYTADPGSPSLEKLQLLMSWAAPGTSNDPAADLPGAHIQEDATAPRRSREP